MKQGELFYYNKEDLTNYSWNLALNLININEIPRYESDDEVSRRWFVWRKIPMTTKMKKIYKLYEDSVKDSKQRYMNSIWSSS